MLIKRSEVGKTSFQIKIMLIYKNHLQNSMWHSRVNKYVENLEKYKWVRYLDVAPFKANDRLSRGKYFSENALQYVRHVKILRHFAPVYGYLHLRLLVGKS